MLSPLLYSLFTHDCVATHASNSIIKFADDTTAVGLITNNDETAYREEVRALGVWCQEYSLIPNVSKTKYKQPPEPLPVHPATIQKARSVQVHQSWDREIEKQLKAIRLLNSHH